MKFFRILAIALWGFVLPASAFEGRITAVLTRGGEAQTLVYTVGTNDLRIERGESDRPYARNLINLDTGAITILFPHNRSFIRLKSSPAAPGAFPNAADMNTPRPLPAPMAVPPDPATMRAGPTNTPSIPPPPSMPQMSAGIGPQAGVAPGAPSMPTMPMMPAMPMEPTELKATDQTTNLLGYGCTRYELKQRGEVMEIWATDKLLPFQPYLQNQPHRFGPRLIEEHWEELLKAKKMFPLLAILKFENGTERMRFEVKSVTPEKIKKEDAEQLFQLPANYQEIQPLPF